MEALSTKTLELSVGREVGEAEPKRRHRLFYGSYAYYLDRIAREESNDFFAGEISASDNLEVKPPGNLPPSERREQEKQKQALVRRIQRQEAETLKDMEKLETEKKRLEEELGKPEVYSSGEKAKAVKLALDKTAAALDAKSREWEGIAGELERARNNALLLPNHVS
jgi:ATP-binding cassette subfamily F protein 3